MKLFSIFLSLIISLSVNAQTKLTVITDKENKTITEESITSQKKLRSEILKKLISETAEKAVELDWDEGTRGFVSSDTDKQGHFNINKMKIINGEVVFMEVEFHGFLKYYPAINGDPNFEFVCKVDLEKYDEEKEFLSEYAYCVVDDGEEIEYEN